MLELAGADFNAAVRTMIHEAKVNTLEASVEIDVHSRGRETIKKEPYGNYRTETYSTRDFKKPLDGQDGDDSGKGGF